MLLIGNERDEFVVESTSALRFVPETMRELGEEAATEEELLAMLKGCPDEWLKIWWVGKMVGNVKNERPQLLMKT